MENFKECLNKCSNNQYEFVKLCDLEHEKKYEVTLFEYFDTENGKTITVILDNKFRVFLPDRFIDEFTNEKILLYKNSKTKFNLVYKGKKNINKGKTMHLINFE